MKFTSVAVVMGSALSAFATPAVEAREPTLVERDLATVTGVLNTVQSSVTALDNAIKAYNGGSNVVTVQTASDNLVKAINAGTSTINGSGDLSETDALQLPGPVQDLINLVKTTISDLEAKKSQAVAACLGGVVLTDLNQQKGASSALATAITNKVPQSLQSIASSLSSQITDAIQGGINAFQGTATCSSSGSSGPTSTGSGSTSTGSSPPTTSSASSASSSAATSTPVSLPGGSLTSTPSGVTPISTPTPSTSGPAPITNAAVVNGFSVSAVLAAFAAVFAF